MEPEEIENRFQWHERILTELMQLNNRVVVVIERLEVTLQAIKDLLERGNNGR